MLPKSRHRNRGSQSLFSSDLLRSIARGRSHPDIGISASTSDLRSQSSLSCDPYAQDGPINSRAERLHPVSSSFSTVSVAAPYYDNSRGDTTSPSAISSNGLRRRWKRQRLSWLPSSLSKVSRDGKHGPFTTVPPAASMSSLSSSSISSPVLIGTTNTQVANITKVDRSEISLPVSCQSVSHSPLDTNNKSEHTGVVLDLDNTFTWTSSVRSVRSKIGHSRKASTGLKLSASWSGRKDGHAGHPEVPSTSRFRKGRIATCREKLHHLKARLLVLPVDVGSDVVVQPPNVKAKEIQSQELDNTSRSATPRVTSFLPKLHSDSTTDLLRDSLSRSFASAVDKLDLNSSPTLVNDSPSMAPLRKTKSVVDLFSKYMGLDKSREENADEAETTTQTTSDNSQAKDTDEVTATDSGVPKTDEDASGKCDNTVSAKQNKDNSDVVNQSKVPTHAVPNKNRSKSPEFRLNMDSDVIPPMPPMPMPPASKPEKSKSYRDEKKPVEPSDAWSLTTTSARNGHHQIATRSLKSVIQPGSLNSFPEVTSFGSPGRPLVPVTPSQGKSSTTTYQGPSKNEDGDGELEEASMYTPETNEMRYYVRTPSPKIKQAVVVPIRPRVPEETPTKRPVFNKLKKSISGFFGKSAIKGKAVVAVPVEEEEEKEEEKEEVAVAAPVGVRSYAPATPSPLRNRANTAESKEKRRCRADWGDIVPQIEETQRNATPPYN